ncbi:hypothetical protein FACS189449_13690 [Alphaproteobacteria bacterium]|nr:hypothetical protein FACS189449_13690 [Alphaproteobacteria bacterium]
MIRRISTFFKKSVTGAAMVEMALTIPVLLMLVFYTLEMVRINNVRTALESIAAEATFVLIEGDDTQKIEPIINKYMPAYVAHNRIQFTIRDDEVAIGTDAAFVLTLVCDYPFLSDFVKKFFSGGINSTGQFLLRARGCSIYTI